MKYSNQRVNKGDPKTTPTSASFALPYNCMQYWKSFFKNRNYLIGPLSYFNNNCHEDQSKPKYIS